MSSSQDRAERRRSQWHGEVVEAGTAKGRLYRSLTPIERLAAFTRLNEQVWQIARKEPGNRPAARRDWPGEVFEIQKRD